MRKHKAKKFFMFVFLAPIAVVGFGFIFMWLWNWLIPTLFAGPVITFWQGLGLIAIGKILFGGCHGSKKCKCCKGHNGGIKDKWKAKWESMPEDKKNEMKAYCKSWACDEEKSDNETAKSTNDENSN